MGNFRPGTESAQQWSIRRVSVSDRQQRNRVSVSDRQQRKAGGPFLGTGRAPSQAGKRSGMGMRKYVIGVIAGLAGALALSGVASAAVTSLRIESQDTPAKQDKKVRGPV